MYTQLTDQAVQFVTIPFSMSFACTQFKCQTVLFDPLKDPIRCYTFGPEWPWVLTQ